MTKEQKLKKLKDKVNKLSEKLESEIRGICEMSDYRDSSTFSYNIDRLNNFTRHLNEFEFTNKN